MARIIFVTTLTLWSMGKGHGGPAFTQTVKKYLDEGWDVTLISDESSNKDYPHLDKDHNILLAPTCFKKYQHLRKIGLIFRWLDHQVMSHRFYKTAKRVIGKETKDTILYAYEIFGVKASKKLSLELGIPVVTRFQGTILSQYANTLANHIRRYPHYQALSTPADLIIMTNDGTFGARVLQELGNQSPKMFLRNGLDLMARDIPAMKVAFDSNAFRASLGVQQEETMFLTVSRLVGWKRVERAINGLAECLKTQPDAKLVIVGDGDAKDDLMRLAAERGIADRVIFTGAVPHDDVYRYMMACDVFLSLYDLSNVGNPLLEAMTLGKCIITLDVGDTRSLIHNRENGVLLTVDTLPSLGNVMAELAEDESLRARLGDAASDYAHAHFNTWRDRMETEFQAVSKLLSQHH